ncbi:MAG: radical SAM protein [Candidatus Omnitrophica bacterium]|nr:radical SAM protein [Candidatus Omnitrophota bacterium]
MKSPYISTIKLPQFSLWEKEKKAKNLISFDLEITARCNLNCRHCYVNLPVNDHGAKTKELNFDELKRIVDEAFSLGALWCLITGGEPLLREDFFDIYLYLKQKGLLVSIFTNATLITSRHIKLFQQYPPRDIEVTVYGVTEETYETVTRSKGSFKAFMRGLNLLLENKIKVRLKAMALRSNVGELAKIARFCRKYTKDYFRFDPLLHLRFDANPKRNEEIISERLDAAKIVEIEKRDSERSEALRKGCDKLINHKFGQYACDHLFHCGTGVGSFYVSYDGFLKLCSSLNHSECIYNLRHGSLHYAYKTFIPKVRIMRSGNPEFLTKCRRCPIINLCLWCPAHAYLETGRLDTPVDYFCKVAYARAKMLKPDFV